MPITKKAITIDGNAFLLAEELARSLKVSRSRILEMAVEEFARHRKNQQITEQLNEVYVDGLDPEEESQLKASQRAFRKVLDEW